MVPKYSSVSDSARGVLLSSRPRNGGGRTRREYSANTTIQLTSSTYTVTKCNIPS
uniref:Uncharacterized protein n=1 Tax=Arundo donax TaxID=35708 RepID=A0A0A9H544_ARUDO